MKNFGIIAIVTYLVVVVILFLVNWKKRFQYDGGSFANFRGGSFRGLIFFGGAITIVLMLVLKIFVQ